MPKISVIMPVYRTEATVAAAIESVLAQTEPDFELVCVDDGSPDRAGEILASYAAKDPRIRVFTQENRGLSGARNTGLDHAAGEYVTFLDSDDALPRHALATFLAAAEKTGASVVVSEAPVDVATEDEKARAAAAAAPRDARVRVSRTPLKTVVAGRRMRSSAWNKFYRRAAIGDRRFIEGIYFEDWPFVTELLGDLDQVAIVSAPCYVYSKIGASIVRSAFTAKKVASYAEGIRHVTAWFEGHPQRKWAMKRVAMARRMMAKRAKRAGLPLPGDMKSPSVGKRLENLLHAAAAAWGRWKCRHVYTRVEPKKIVFNQFQGGGFGCNPKYIAAELLRRRRDLDLVWLARDAAAVQRELPAGIRAVAWKSPAALRELATAGVWVANHNLGHFVRHCGLVKKPGQRYYQTWHGSFGIKRCTETLGAAEARMLDGFFANCTWEATLARGWFGPSVSLHMTGHPRNDPVVQSRGRAPGAARTLLYVPTFRDDGSQEAYLVDFAAVAAALARRWPADWKVQVRLHPNMRKKGVRLPFAGDVEDVTDYPDIQELLAAADAVVSDYSSCIFDFALSGRPAFVYAPDRAKYETERGFYYPLAETPFPVAESPAALVAAIAAFDEAAYARRCADFFAAKGSAEKGDAAAQAAEIILKGMDAS